MVKARPACGGPCRRRRQPSLRQARIRRAPPDATGAIGHPVRGGPAPHPPRPSSGAGGKRLHGARPPWRATRWRAHGWLRTLAETPLRVRTVEDPRRALSAFREPCNAHWPIGRHGHRAPARFGGDRLDSGPPGRAGANGSVTIPGAAGPPPVAADRSGGSRAARPGGSHPGRASAGSGPAVPRSHPAKVSAPRRPRLGRETR